MPPPAGGTRPLPRALRMITSDPPANDRLPEIVSPAASVFFTTPLPDGALIPPLIAEAGESAAWRYVDFFTSNIRNPNTRRAYARACHTFFAWCDERGLTLTTIRPYDVATYIETRGLTHSAPDVKQQLAAVRMLFDWLITGQVVPHNPAAAVRGPKHVVKPARRRCSMPRSGELCSTPSRPRPSVTCATAP
jgi:Phage integrase, N-terminal SAM-like domain